MNKIIVVAVFVFGALAGGFGGHWRASQDSPQKSVDGVLPPNSKESSTDTSAQDLLAADIKEFEKQLAELNQQAADQNAIAKSSARDSEVSKLATVEDSIHPQFASLEEAVQQLQQGTKLKDPEMMWQALFGMLAFGEEGYQQILQLETLEKNSAVLKSLGMGRSGELYLGKFFRAMADHGEQVLDFSRYIDTLPEEELPYHIKDFREDFFGNELGPLVVGFVQPKDSQLIESIRSSVIKRLSDGSSRGGDDQIALLAQLPGEGRAQELLDLWDVVTERRRIDLVRAVRFVGDPSVLPALIEVKNRTTEVETMEHLLAAIKSLEAID